MVASSSLLAIDCAVSTTKGGRGLLTNLVMRLGNALVTGVAELVMDQAGVAS